MLNFHYYRYQSGNLFNCMKFEALHQTFKRYAKNCGFKNVGKTMSERFQQKIALEFSEKGQYKTHPLYKKDVTPGYKNNEIVYVNFMGTILKPDCNIIIPCKRNKMLLFGMLTGWNFTNGRLFTNV